ncbi:MAG: hypothetical protein ABSH01_10880 [Terriglobia bacterium]|jgi:uncharacterized membrane protein YuzA (DUF378 family)
MDVSSPPPKVAARSEPEPPRRGNVSLLESASRLGAFFIAAVYAGGYLIIALHGSHFGIVEFSPFRPRIFSAGALLALLLVVPLVAASRAFHLFGLRNPALVSVPVKPENVKYLQLSCKFDFYNICFGLCALSAILFPPDYLQTRPWGLTFFFAVLAFAVVSVVAQKKRFDPHPLSSTVLSALSATAVAVVAFQFFGRSFFWLSIWYYFVGIAALYLHGVFESPDKRTGLEWEKAIFFLLSALVAFATVIYGRIAPSFGGGSPIPAVLHLATDVPISSSRSMSVLMVDENDYGYYVLKPGQESTAYFLRRDQVSSIEFGNR